MLPKDQKRFFEFYKNALEKYGEDARSLHWIDEKSQNIRFDVFNELINFSDKSVLDVGCGFGDLYGFFISKKINVYYTGIDIIPEFITHARKKFPEVKFRVEDVFSTTESYDYIVASGALNFNVTDSKNYYFSMIRKMFECSKHGLVFNMLNETAHIKDDIFLPQNINEITTYCKTMTQKVVTISDYLPWDFTVYMYK